MTASRRSVFAGSVHGLALSIALGMMAIVACSTEANGPRDASATTEDSGDAGNSTAADGGVSAPSSCTPDIETIQKTVFLSRCKDCHDRKSPAASLDLESPGVEARLIGARATKCGGKTLVVPGDADRSYLVEKLAAAKPACGTQMPNFGALDDADVDCVRAWVNSLAPDVADGGPDDR